MALDDPDNLATLRQRYGEQQRPANIVWNDVIAAQLAHRSVRNY